MSGREESYRGLPGAFWYSFRWSSSLTYKSYVIVSTLVTLLIAIIFTLGLIGVVAGTLGASELVTLVRSFFILVGVIVVIPIIAPIILVARRHRRDIEADSTYDTWLAVTGYVFLIALYLGLIVTVPPAQQQTIDGNLGTIVGLMYRLPAAFGIIPPSVAVVLIYLVHLKYR